jgi:hypothetical protein
MHGWSTTLALLLAVSATPCSSGSGSVEPEGGDGHGEPHDRADEQDRREDDRRERVSTSECVPGQPCTEYGQTCENDHQHCHCASPCTGAELPPEEMRPRWQCREVDPHCPEGIPEQGTRCRPKGLRCGYGTCGGASATCEDGHWKVVHYGPPA